MSFRVSISPKTLTIITTYKCTAACGDCCFECSPKLSSKLSLDEIIDSINSARTEFPDLELVVFTGGECFIFKKILFMAIKHCKDLGLKTRCVTNAYWAKSEVKAGKIAEELQKSGLSEINISTGLDHQKWVSRSTVVNAVKALLSNNICTLVTIEKDTDSSKCFELFVNDLEIIQLKKEYLNKFRIQSSSWMPFFYNSKKRDQVVPENLNNGCDQVFTNCVITPNKEVAACCGLTLEHIPEMKLGKIDNLSCFRSEQEDDFLKLWIRVDGPYNILQNIFTNSSELTKGIVHQCQACAVLHKNPSVRKELVKNYSKYIPSVMNKYLLMTNAL